MKPVQAADAQMGLPQLSGPNLRDSIIERIRAHTASELEKEYPWMANVAVKVVAGDVAFTLEQGIIAQEPVMNAAKSRMSFLELPKELRNMVYEMVLKEHSDEGDRRVVIQSTVTEKGEAEDGMEEYSVAGSFAHPPALIQTCQTIRSETLPFFYGSSTFIVELSADVLANIAQAWLRRIDPQCRQLIKHFVIDLQHLDRKLLIEFLSDEAHGYKQAEAFRIYTSKMGHADDIRKIKITIPRKLRTCVSVIKEQFRLDTNGVADSAVSICIRAQIGGLVELIAISPTELVCFFCYKVGEPDTPAFHDGVCVDCEDSEDFEGMRIGPWRTVKEQFW